jgi:hypothetical protein
MVCRESTGAPGPLSLRRPHQSPAHPLRPLAAAVCALHCRRRSAPVTASPAVRAVLGPCDAHLSCPRRCVLHGLLSLQLNSQPRFEGTRRARALSRGTTEKGHNMTVYHHPTAHTNCRHMGACPRPWRRSPRQGKHTCCSHEALPAACMKEGEESEARRHVSSSRDRPLAIPTAPAGRFAHKPADDRIKDLRLRAKHLRLYIMARAPRHVGDSVSRLGQSRPRRRRGVGGIPAAERTNTIVYMPFLSCG